MKKLTAEDRAAWWEIVKELRSQTISTESIAATRRTSVRVVERLQTLLAIAEEQVRGELCAIDPRDDLIEFG